MVMTMVRSTAMKAVAIKASEFKAKCLRLMDQVAETGMPIVITKNGKPIATLAPVRESATSLVGLHRGQVEIVGDIVGPLDVKWSAAR